MIPLWIIAVTGLAQMIWGFARDAQFLKKNHEALAWDNERAVLIANCEKAEEEAKKWRNTHDGVVVVMNRFRQSNLELKKRLEKNGLDETH